MKTVGVFDNLKITEWEVEPLNGERDKRIEAYGKDYSCIKTLAYETKKMCIYGAGVNGEIICKYLRDLNIDIDFLSIAREYEARYGCRNRITMR